MLLGRVENELLCFHEGIFWQKFLVWLRVMKCSSILNFLTSDFFKSRMGTQVCQRFLCIYCSDSDHVCFLIYDMF